MLKYLYNKIVFSEIPNEVTLGISVSGCQIHCKGCNQRELWEDKGTELTKEELRSLVKANKGISCLLILGGEHDIDWLKVLFLDCKCMFPKLKRAWYCGLDLIPKEHKDILHVLDYVKTGHYDQELGGLADSTTNQKLFEVEHTDSVNEELKDITYKLQRKNED